MCVHVCMCVLSANIYFTCLHVCMCTCLSARVHLCACRVYRACLCQDEATSADGSASAEAAPMPSSLGRPLSRIDVRNFLDLIKESRKLYERSFKKLRMLLFPEILNQLAFVVRAFASPSRHAGDC